MLAQAEPLALVCFIDASSTASSCCCAPVHATQPKPTMMPRRGPTHPPLPFFDDTGSALGQGWAKRCASKDQLDCLKHPTPLKSSRALYIPEGHDDYGKA